MLQVYSVLINLCKEVPRYCGVLLTITHLTISAVTREIVKETSIEGTSQ